MKVCILLISHQLTEEQKKDLQKKGVDKIIGLPEILLKQWSNVPPELDELKEYAKKFIDWIETNANKNDFVWVQGDYGLTNIIVEFCFKNGLVPIYSTTERIHKEVKLPDGSIGMKKIFKHKIFRRYERWED